MTYKSATINHNLQTDKKVPYLYVGGGFPRASQFIITFFSSESKGKITSSGSWIKTGPNSSLSVDKKRRIIAEIIVSLKGEHC